MAQASRKRIAFVTPRFGAQIYGGAEKLAREYAVRLTQRYEVEVLTTCAVDYRTWENQFEPGTSDDCGVTVRRFRVSRTRKRASFDRLSQDVRERSGSLSLAEQETWMREQGPDSAELMAFLSAKGGYDAYVFLPYLYATTYFGLPLVATRSLLIPLAHDEWPIYLGMWRRLFEQAASRAYVSEEERAFVQGLFGQGRASGSIVSSGIDAKSGVAQRFRMRYGLEETFALYIGRIDASKGCEELVEHFAQRGSQDRYPEKLVLIGPGHARARSCQMLFTGEVDDETKWDALAACSFFVMPSAYESLSYAVLEAWASSKPVLVNARSPVLVAHCRKSNGGLWYLGSGEFWRAAGVLRTSGTILGEQGQFYVREHFSWTTSIAALCAEIEKVSSAAG